MVRASVGVLFALCVVPVLIGGAGRPRRSVKCDPGWIQRSQICYKVVTNMKASWPDAQVYCNAVGGILADPRNEDEGNFVRHLAMNHSLYCPWIGVIDVNSEGRWVSSATKRPVTYANWAAGEPNNFEGAKENCVCIGQWISYKWNDDLCHKAFDFICQKALR